MSKAQRRSWTEPTVSKRKLWKREATRDPLSCDLALPNGLLNLRL